MSTSTLAGGRVGEPLHVARLNGTFASAVPMPEGRPGGGEGRLCPAGASAVPLTPPAEPCGAGGAVEYSPFGVVSKGAGFALGRCRSHALEPRFVELTAGPGDGACTRATALAPRPLSAPWRAAGLPASFLSSSPPHAARPATRATQSKGEISDFALQGTKAAKSFHNSISARSFCRGVLRGNTSTRVWGIVRRATGKVRGATLQ